MHRNARRVQAALEAAGSAAKVRVLDDSARTAADAASALGVEVGQIAKSLVFMVGGTAVLVVASGSDRVDTKRLSAEFGDAPVTRADADAVRAATGYPIGGVSPVDLPPELPVLVEEALGAFAEVWAAAGTPHAVFPTTYSELLALTGGSASDVRER